MLRAVNLVEFSGTAGVRSTGLYPKRAGALVIADVGVVGVVCGLHETTSNMRRNNSLIRWESLEEVGQIGCMLVNFIFSST